MQVTAEKQRRQGRPKGSRNKQREVVIEIPAACPKCGATDSSKALPNPIVRDYPAGTLSRYPAVTRITTRRMVCLCGNCWSKQTYSK